ncbi:hypothetical protein B0H17DRAFT_1123635 [Mycena rosella]|uniref:Uncharacterized protein n=1 Tax=Mycena rosella TaxID=1033263 RepID=A0AAD7MCF3_MYCRO|nr:hypothetical protein B0H17DRAFT_1123635 [Mycena rosella]
MHVTIGVSARKGLDWMKAAQQCRRECAAHRRGKDGDTGVWAALTDSRKDGGITSCSDRPTLRPAGTTTHQTKWSRPTSLPIVDGIWLRKPLRSRSSMVFGRNLMLIIQGLARASAGLCRGRALNITNPAAKARRRRRCRQREARSVEESWFACYVGMEFGVVKRKLSAPSISLVLKPRRNGRFEAHTSLFLTLPAFSTYRKPSDNAAHRQTVLPSTHTVFKLGVAW